MAKTVGLLFLADFTLDLPGSCALCRDGEATQGRGQGQAGRFSARCFRSRAACAGQCARRSVRLNRMVELKRFRDHLKAPLNLQPRFFPAPADLGGAIHRRRGPGRRQRCGDAARGAVLSACWAEERNVAGRRNSERDLQGSRA